MPKKFSFIFVTLISSIILCGCGYTTRSLLPSNYRTIHVQHFENKVDYTNEGARNLYFPLMEVTIRNKVIDRYLFDGNLKIAEEDDADLVLRAKLLDYDRNVLRYNDNDDAQEYRVYITVDLELWDPVKEEAVWVENGFVGETTYFIEGSQAVPESEAVDNGIEDLARRIVERTIENW